MKRKAPKGKQEPDKLKRFKSEIMTKFGSDDHSSQDGSSPRSTGGRPRKPPHLVISRKERRKQERKLKKQRKTAFYQHKPKAKDLEVQGMRESIKKEDRTIKQLEKQLGIKKNKKKKDLGGIPQSFRNDGLDYLLEVVDGQYGEESDEDLVPKSSWDVGSDDSEDDFSAEESPSDNEEEIEPAGSETDSPEDSESEEQPPSPKKQKQILKTTTKKKEKKTKKSVHFADNLVEADEEPKSANNSDQKSKSAKNKKPDKLHEDIYGRLRDTTGGVVKATSAYVPPGKRQEMAGSADETKRLMLDRIKKQIKGLLNRLSESNLQSISSELAGMYHTHSRMDVTATLIDVVMSACVAPITIPERLITEHALLVAVLHANTNSQVGAHVLETVACQFGNHLEAQDYGDTKEMDNLLVLLGNLYNFKVVHSSLIFDLLQRLCNSFGEFDIPLIILLLKNVGMCLRKDDPAAFKDIIVVIQTKAANADTSSAGDPTRVRFMLEVLLAIKNNNMRKIPNYDPSRLEQLRKIYRICTQSSSSSSESELRVTLSDLMEAHTRGRWWLVGSAWSGDKGRAEPKADHTEHTVPVTEMSAQLLSLAREQRMNTDVRRNIFCVIMTCEDFVDAFENLLHLGLKGQQEREIVHVIMDLCLQEKQYNPFYAYLAQKFCEYERRYQLTVQVSLWEKFKTLDELGATKLSHMAAYLTHLLVSKALSLSVFKVIEFGDLDKFRVRFMKKVLVGLMLDQPEHVTTEVFSRISGVPKLQTLREGLKLFMKHFILRDKKAAVDLEILKEHVERAEKALSVSDSKFLL